jgi:3D (Asp-Asp-Asp) domain-containing protein
VQGEHQEKTSMSKIIIVVAAILIIALILRIKKSYFKLQFKIFKAWTKMKIEQIWEAVRIYVIILLSISIGYSACFDFIEYKKLMVDYNSALEASESAQNTLKVIENAKAASLDQVEPEIVPSAKSEAMGAEFTAYNAEVGQTDADPFTMASGKKVYDGAIANNCLDFGTKVKVNGKIKIVEDRMNSRYDCDHFDIFMDSHAEAVAFGRQNLIYEVIK